MQVRRNGRGTELIARKIFNRIPMPCIKGLLAMMFVWVIGVELVAWWCLDMSALGGMEFWPVVLWGVTPFSMLAGALVGCLVRTERFGKRGNS